MLKLSKEGIQQIESYVLPSQDYHQCSFVTKQVNMREDYVLEISNQITQAIFRLIKGRTIQTLALIRGVKRTELT